MVFLVAILITIENRLRRTEERLEQAEASLKVLEPLRRIFAGYQPTAAGRTADPYQAGQATGPPDVETYGRDSVLAWCPATEDAGEEWLVLEYDQKIEASAVSIRASWNPGAATRVLAIVEDDTVSELWSGPAIGTAAGWEQEIKFVEPTRMRRLRIEFDTAAVPGWNEVDAVGLLDAEGRFHWAEEASASSNWSREEDEAQAEGAN
jgi:hypothetical protein